jgi:hypothetical protein
MLLCGPSSQSQHNHKAPPAPPRCTITAQYRTPKPTSQRSSSGSPSRSAGFAVPRSASRWSPPHR